MKRFLRSVDQNGIYNVKLKFLVLENPTATFLQASERNVLLH